MYIKSQPYYDNKTQRYYSILCFNKLPSHPLLKAHVVRIQNNKLSPFEDNITCYAREQCLFAIKNSLLNGVTGHRSCIEYLTFDDYVYLLDFLIENGFTVNTSITNMLQKNTTHVPQNLLCFIGH